MRTPLIGVANLRLAHGVIPPRASWPARSDGITLPDAETTVLFAQIPRPYRVLKSTDNTAGAVTIAQPLGASRGIIVLVGNDFTSDFEETSMDAEFLANSDWLAIAVCGEGRQLTAGLRTAFTDTAFVVTQQPPWMLAINTSNGLADLIQVRPGTLVGVTLCTTRASFVCQILPITGKAQPSLAVVGLAEHVTACRSANWPAPGPTWLSVRCTNQGSWQRERRTSIRAQAQGLIPAKGRLSEMN